jgi:cell division protein FtsQ
MGVLAAGGYSGAGLVVAAPWLQITTITVEGNERVSAPEVVALVDGLRGANILTADLHRWRERLFASPWIGDAALRRRLPSAIEVVIRERQPIGLARVGSELLLVDAAGTAIDVFGPRYADCDLPIVDGLVVERPGLAPEIDRARSRLLARLMADLRARPDLAGRVSQIDVRDIRDVHVILANDSAVLRLGDTRFAARLAAYVELQAALRERVPDIDYVDLRFGERVYVGPASRVSAAPVGVTGPVPGPASTGRH